MKIWVNPRSLQPSKGQTLELPRMVWQRLPALMPEVVFDQSASSPEGASAQLTLYGSFFEDTPPPFCFLQDIDRKDSWWSSLFSDSTDLDWMVTGAAGIFLPHQALATALKEKMGAFAPLHVIGHGLPNEVQQLRPADSVTRRITKEVYGREKSFFLAPSTGHSTDNLERLVRAYDRFRQRCPEEVMLIIGGTAKAQARALRRAVKSAKYRADISFLPQLSAAEHWKVYSSARAILYPSLSTRFPAEVLKAWHARVPVMAVDNEVLMGGGAQVQGEDVKSMVEALTALVTTPFLASGLVDNGTRRLAEFTWEKVTERVAKVLREFTEHSAPKSS